MQTGGAPLPDLSPQMAEGLNRALTHQREGRLFDADMIFRQLGRGAGRLQGVHPMVGLGAAWFTLLKGELEDAWPLLERRLFLDHYVNRPFTAMTQPLWDGAPMPGGRLFLIVDQGLGDTILLARFLPWVLDRVGSLAMQVNPGTAGFWARRFPDADIGEHNDPLPDCDARIDMFTLPLLFGATADNLPAPPYVAADPAEREHWRDRLGGGFRVGLSWQGNPNHARDFERSIPLQALAPLFDVPGARFFGLQVVHGREQMADLPAGADFTDLGEEIMAADQPLEASAALVAELDLVICIDSALANLAAAMDRPFWLPTYKIPDWRWATFPDLVADNPAPAPWYRAHRLFRCAERAKWDDVVAAMAGELTALAAEG